MKTAIERCTWPACRLPELFFALVEKTALAESGKDRPEPRREIEDPAEWIAWAAKACACDVDRFDGTLASFEEELSSSYPAILQIGPDEYLSVLRSARGRIRVLAPDLSARWLRADDVYESLAREAEVPGQDKVDRLLEEASVSQSRRAQTRRLFLREQLARVPFRDCWVLRSAAGARMGQWLRQASIVRNGSGLVVAHALQYLLWIVSWAVLGQLSFQGHFDAGWRMGWALLLLTMIPLQLLTTWKQGQLVIGFGGLLKRRLLYGAMQLGPEEMRHGGIGSYISQALEAESVESLALSGGVQGALAVIELLVAAFLLGSMAPALALWVAAAGWAAWQFFRRYQSWTGARLGITDHLVEAMMGQRTRSVQQRQAEWHTGEDDSLKNYLGASRTLDRMENWLTMAVPRGWLFCALLCFAPSMFQGGQQPAQVAAIFGGILLAYTGFRRLTGSAADVAIFFESVRRIRTLFQAAARREPSGAAFAVDGGVTRPADKVIEAEGVSYRYRPYGGPALQDCSLTIRRGDRVLLQGPSGGGKTTLASVLSGMRTPEQGLLLAMGLDRHALGPARWRKRIATAPQFHENHIFTETLAFNLLMGRGATPTENDFEEAEAICRELGLGDLLDRMPSGILQMVGEGGWQLSHGERSRVFIARALLQRSDLVILDESFGALDPESLQVAMECALNRAETLMVIAHP